LIRENYPFYGFEIQLPTPKYKNLLGYILEPQFPRRIFL